MKQATITYVCDAADCHEQVQSSEEFSGLPDAWTSVEVPDFKRFSHYHHITKHFCSLEHAASYLRRMAERREEDAQQSARFGVPDKSGRPLR